MSSGNLLEFPQPFTANLIVLYIDISYGAYLFFSSFPDLSDSEVELTIVRGLNIPLPSGEYFDLLLVINWIQNLLPINYQSFKASGKGLGSLVILNITNFASTYCNWPQWAHHRGRPEFWLVWIFRQRRRWRQILIQYFSRRNFITFLLPYLLYLTHFSQGFLNCRNAPLWPIRESRR